MIIMCFVNGDDINTLVNFFHLKKNSIYKIIQRARLKLIEIWKSEYNGNCETCGVLKGFIGCEKCHSLYL